MVAGVPNTQTPVAPGFRLRQESESVEDMDKMRANIQQWTKPGAKFQTFQQSLGTLDWR
jgi:hypothetical protein